MILGFAIIFLVLFGHPSWALAQDDPPNHWIYLRDGQPLAARQELVELVVVGDLMLGRTVLAKSQTLQNVAPWISQADLAMGNFEGVLTPPGEDPGRLSQTLPGAPYQLVMGRQVPALLQSSGFDLLSLANNHSLDLKTKGLVDTTAALESAGLGVVGVSPQPGVPAPILIRTIKGVKIAFLAFSMIPTPYQSASGPQPTHYDAALSATAVKAARQQAEFVVVIMHWGIEYQIHADPAQVSAAQNLFAAGADLILGQHPHVVQGTNILYPDSAGLTGHSRGAGFVAYSLGNFIFDQFDGETFHGLALRIYLDHSGLRAVQAIPVQAGTHPRLLSASDSVSLIERIQPSMPIQAGFTCDQKICRPTSGAAHGQGGLFKNGQVDLTGDGQPEIVQLVDDVVTIEQAGTVVWRSPAAWQVMDLALGDPNDDGRAEMLISLRKPDAEGILRSHPFIVGYRGGKYKILWGGSALSTPISEVELGDVDGDGHPELLVLEEQAGVSRSVGVLNWHGWGFVLQWRSEPGYFKNLALTPDENSQKENIVISLFIPQ